jgi:hypothetical protein
MTGGKTKKGEVFHSFFLGKSTLLLRNQQAKKSKNF